MLTARKRLFCMFTGNELPFLSVLNKRVDILLTFLHDQRKFKESTLLHVDSKGYFLAGLQQMCRLFCIQQKCRLACILIAVFLIKILVINISDARGPTTEETKLIQVLILSCTVDR
jgi:hypothetical protein